MSVKTVVQKLELESADKYKQEKVKKKETEKEMSKKTMMKKKEDILDLSVKTVTAYLQGLGPETRQGPAPTSSYLESGDLARVSRSSSAGPSLRVEDIRGHKVLD